MAHQRLNELRKSLKQVQSMDELRGKEGAAASAYFSGYTRVFAPALGFTGRNRRPPKDPVNAVLSLTYTLLSADASRALMAAGFDPMLGFYHRPAYGRHSLAVDMLELYRARADRFVWHLFQSAQLRPEHFTGGDTRACLLGKSGREHFYQSYDQHCSAWRRLMLRTARHWMRRLTESMPPGGPWP